MYSLKKNCIQYGLNRKYLVYRTWAGTSLNRLFGSFRTVQTFLLVAYFTVAEILIGLVALLDTIVAIMVVLGLLLKVLILLSRNVSCVSP